MSTQYNMAMLRALLVPMTDSLAQLEQQAEEVASGARHPHHLEAWEEVQKVTSSLQMVGCRALGAVTASLAVLARGVARYEEMGWTEEVVRHKAPVLATAAHHIKDYLDQIHAGQYPLPVLLWPLWAKIAEATSEPVPDIELMFEIDPQFNDMAFSPMASDLLRSTVQGGLRRIADAIEQLEKATDATGVEQALRSAGAVFDWAYNLLHRRGWQGYWLMLRARVALGLIQGKPALWPKDAWIRLLLDARVDMERFADDAPRLTPERLYETLQPLLRRWPPSWTVAHPALKEFDERFGITGFWSGVDAAMDTRKSSMHQSFAARRSQLHTKLTKVRLSWTKMLLEGAGLDQAIASLITWLEERDAFPGDAVDPVFVALRHLMDILTQEEARAVEADKVFEVKPAIALEFARIILWLEDILEQDGVWGKEVAPAARRLAKRLESAMEGGSAQAIEEAGSAVWDEKRRALHRYRVRSALFKEIREDLRQVEEITDEYLRFGDDDAAQRLPDLLKRLKLGVSVCHLLHASHAAHWMKIVAESLETLPSSKKIDWDEKARTRVTQGIAALSAFLEASIRQEPDADRHLQGQALQELVPAAHPLEQRPTPSFEVWQEGLSLEEAERRVQAALEEERASLPLSPPSLPLPSSVSDISSTSVEMEEEDPEHDEGVQDVSQEEVAPPPSELTRRWAAEGVDENADSDVCDADLEEASAEESASDVTTGTLFADLEEDLPPFEKDGSMLLPLPEPLLHEHEARMPEPQDVSSSVVPSELALDFLEELDEVITASTQAVDALLQNPQDEEALQVVRRGCHTMKGTGRLVGYHDLADMAAPFEQHLDDVLALHTPLSPAEIDLLEKMLASVSLWRHDRRKGNDPLSLDVLVHQLRTLAPVATPPAPRHSPPTPPSLSDVPPQAPTADPELRAVMEDEIRGYVRTLEALMLKMPSVETSQAFHRIAHTLASLGASWGCPEWFALGRAFEYYAQANPSQDLRGCIRALRSEVMRGLGEEGSSDTSGPSPAHIEGVWTAVDALVAAVKGLGGALEAFEEPSEEESR